MSVYKMASIPPRTDRPKGGRSITQQVLGTEIFLTRQSKLYNPWCSLLQSNSERSILGCINEHIPSGTVYLAQLEERYVCSCIPTFDSVVHFS